MNAIILTIDFYKEQKTHTKKMLKFYRSGAMDYLGATKGNIANALDWLEYCDSQIKYYTKLLKLPS